jgi:hypothetical protein
VPTPSETREGEQTGVEEMEEDIPTPTEQGAPPEGPWSVREVRGDNDLSACGTKEGAPQQSSYSYSYSYCMLVLCYHTHMRRYSFNVQRYSTQ